MATRTIKSKGPLYRTFTFTREAVNEEDRTIELTFSSETEEVVRWFGVEILDHKKSSVRLDRLRSAGPLLFNHDTDQHIGVIEQVKIADRKGTAVVRFGNSALADEKFQDAKDRILVNVSMGYRPFKAVLEKTGSEGEPDVYRCTDWEPYEISLLPVAADISVGVGRAADESFDIVIEEREMPKPNEDQNKGGAADTGAGGSTQTAQTYDRTAVENEIRETEQKRSADLLAMGEKFAQYGARELAAEYIKTGKKPSELYRAIVERLPSENDAGTRGAAPIDQAVLDMSSRDLKKYSLLRALNAVIDARKGDHKALERAAFEMECSHELSERFGREARGLFVPIDVVTRAMTTTTAADLVGTEHMADMFIEALRPQSVVLGLGATVMDGLQGNVEIPRELATPTFGWIGDDDDAVLSDGGTGMLKLSPKTLAGGVPMSRRLLKQSSPSVERVIQNALLKGAGLGIDKGILLGTGTNNQPTGVFNMPGINTQTVATPGSPTWAETVGFESKVAADNALMGALGYVTTSGVRGSMKTTPKAANASSFILDNNEANGYKVSVSNQLPVNSIVFGDWDDVFVAFWGILDLNPDLATKAGSGGMILRVFQDADVGIAHAESFCINA